MKNKKTILAALAVLLLVLAGCGSDDSVTPNEQPTFTAEDAATQSGFIAAAMVRVFPDLNSKQAGDHVETVSDSRVDGSYWANFDTDHIWTDAENYLVVQLGSGFEPGNVTFDISAAGTPRLANGTGSLSMGAVVVTFNVDDVLVTSTGYPSAGQIIVSSSGYTATIALLPGNVATVTVGALSWNVNLSTGAISS